MMGNLQKILERKKEFNCLLIKTTINMLKLSSEHSGINIPNIIKDWEVILEELEGK